MAAIIGTMVDTLRLYLDIICYYLYCSIMVL